MLLPDVSRDTPPSYIDADPHGSGVRITVGDTSFRTSVNDKFDGSSISANIIGDASERIPELLINSSARTNGNSNRLNISSTYKILQLLVTFKAVSRMHVQLSLHVSSTSTLFVPNGRCSKL